MNRKVQTAKQTMIKEIVLRIYMEYLMFKYGIYMSVFLELCILNQTTKYLEMMVFVEALPFSFNINISHELSIN